MAASARTTSTTSGRSSGSPPVSRTSRTPSPTATRASRTSSSVLSSVGPLSHGTPSAGMQYVQRSEQRSVSEMRRSRCTRP